MRVILDADALIALNNTKDSLHKKAIELSDRFEAKMESGYVTWDVIDEAATKLRYQLSKQVSIDFLQSIFDGRLYVILPTSELIGTTQALFTSISQKHTSLTDCMNIAVYRQLELDAIFSFDKVYKQQGLKLLSEMM